MSRDANRRETLTRLLLVGLAGLGLFVAIAAVAIDHLIPGTTPGLNPPQLLLVFCGLLLVAAAFKMRRASFRRWFLQGLRKQLAPITLVTAVTLVVLELALIWTGYSTYFPVEIPQSPLETIPWFKCEKEIGCRFLPELLADACASGEFLDGEQARGSALADLRYCQMNDRGLLSPETWQLEADYDKRTRVMMLGDSFTFGLTAELGKSFVETIEANFPEYIVWNLGVPTTGTNQAVVSFQQYAPRLQPQITILGFYVNDFRNNLFPMDNYTAVKDENGRQLVVQQYHMDIWGHILHMDARTALHYRVRNVDPPASELERLFGLTRLGTVILRATDRVGKAVAAGEFTRRGVEATRGYLQELQDLTAAQDSELLVLLIPHENDLDSPGINFQNAVRLFENLGITYLNPLDALEFELDYMDFEKTNDIHWNSTGHQKIGTMLSDCLRTFQMSQNWSDCEHLTVP